MPFGDEAYRLELLHTGLPDISNKVVNIALLGLAKSI
jgi:hypothetical protein